MVFSLGYSFLLCTIQNVDGGQWNVQLATATHCSTDIRLNRLCSELVAHWWQLAVDEATATGNVLPCQWK